MSNIVISPESGILEFNNNSPSGAAIGSATAPIRLDATGGNSFITGGNLGIGTNSPNRNVSIFQSDSSLAYLQFANSTTTAASSNGLEIGINGDEQAVFFNRENTDMIFRTNNTDRLRILAAGNVGIGTDSPATELDVSGTISGVTGLFSNRLHVGTPIGTHDCAIEAAHGSRQLIVSDTTSVAAGVGGKVDFFGAYQAGGARTSFGSIQAKKTNDSAGHYGGGLALSTRVNGGGAATERLTILESGNVGIGTVSPSQTLHVKGIGMIEDTSSTAYGTLQFGTDTSRYIRGNSAELQVGSTIQQLHFQNTSAVGQIASSAGNGTDAIQILARTVHTSANILEVVNGNGAAPIFTVDYTGNVSGGSFLGTGVGNRITNNGTPYLLSGDVAAEADTLQTVTTRGNTTSTSIISTGPHISGVTGLFSNQVGIGTSSPNSDLHVYAPSSAPTFRISRASNGQVWVQTIDSSARFLLQEAASEGGTLNTRLSIDDAGETLLAPNGGDVGIGTNSPSANGSKTTLHINSDTNGAAIRLSQASNSSLIRYDDTNGLQVGTIASKNLSFETADTTAITIDTGQKVGIGTDSPQAHFQVSGSGVFGVIEANAVNSTVTVAGYDDFGLDFRAHNTWTHWKARVGHGINFQLFNDGTTNQNQVLELGKTTKDNAKVYVRSTGAFIEAGMNASATIPVVSMGCLADSDHLGGAFLDVRDAVTRTHRYEFNRDGTFLASGIKIASKLTHDGDTDTFLEFTDNTITLDAGGEEHIKLEAGGVTINEGGQPNDFRIEGDTDTFLFFVDGSADKIGIGTNSPTHGMVDIYRNGADVELCIHEDAGTHQARLHLRRGGSDWEIINDNHLTIEGEGTERMRITTAGNVGIGTNDPQELLNVSGNIRIDDGKQLKLFSSNNTYNGFIEKSGTNGAISLGQQTEIITDIFLTRTDDGGVQIGESSLYSHGRNAIWPITSPKFAVYAGVTDDGGTGGAGFGFFNQGSAGKFLAMVPDITDANNGGFKLQTMNSSSVVEAMCFDTDGSIGVGTSSPDDKFHIEQDGGSVVMGSPTTSYGGIGFEDTALTAANSALFGLASSTILGVKAGGAIEMKIANNSSLGLLKMEQDKLYYTDGNFGIGTDSPDDGILQVLQENAGFTIVAGADVTAQSLTNDTRKFTRIGMPHYHNAEQPVILMVGDSNGSYNRVSIGGGTSAGNAATQIVFKTASNDATTDGTERMQINSAGDVGIGTDSPTEKLTISGGNILVTGRAAGDDGPQIKLGGPFCTWQIENQYVNGATNDMFRIRNAALGSDALVINRQNNRVGIGTTNPQSPLEVINDSSDDGIILRDDGFGLVTLIGSDGSHNARTRFYNGAHALVAEINANAGSPTYFNAGDVGIGTSSPDGILNTSGDHVLFQGVNKGYVRVRTARANTSDYAGVSSSILTLANYFGQNEFGQFVDNAGNFRIQKSGDNGYLELDANDFTLSGIRLVCDIVNQAPTNLAINLRDESSDEVGFYSPATNVIGFVTDRTERMRIDSAGNVGIGTNSPITGGSALEVVGPIKGGVNVSDKSADFTLSSADNGNFINGTSTSFDQISISSDIGVNFNCTVIHPTKDVDIVGSSSMIINGTTNGTVTLASGYQPASIVRIASNSYAVFGNLL